MALVKTLQTDTGTGSTTSYSALRQGSAGDSVKRLQSTLYNLGYYTGAIDSSYGPKTAAAVRAYQQAKGLTVDSIAGPQTQGSLYAPPKARTTPSSTTTDLSAEERKRLEIASGTYVAPTTPGKKTPSTVTTPPAGGFNVPGDQPGVPVLQVPGSGFNVPGVPNVPSNMFDGTPMTDAEKARLDYAAGLTDPETRTPENDQRVKAGLAPILTDKKQEQKEQEEQENIQKIVEDTTGTGTGGGTGAGTSGTGTGGGTTTTDTGTKTGTTIEGEPATDTWQNYYKKATETQFQYNPAEDQEYLRAASVLEQQVTDMMVGRGGLYSSVAHAALQSRLMSLQVDYQKMAYENFKEERNFNMQIAGFLADREDEEWKRSYQMMTFQADEEQRKFDNKIKTEQLRIAQQNAYASRVAAQARAKQAEAQNKLAFQQADAWARKTQLDSVVESIKTNDMDAESAMYLGGNAASILVNLPYDHPIVQGYIGGAYNYLDYELNNLATAAREAGSVDTYLNAITGFASEQKAPDFDLAYSSALSFAMQSHQNGDDWAYTTQYFLNKSDQFIAEMGPTKYNDLLSWLDKKVATEEKATGGTSTMDNLEELLRE